jgi:hypothetical protein
MPRHATTGAGLDAWRPVPRDPNPAAYQCADPHRGPHNRCAHPTPPPVGYQHCAGDPGCPILIPATAEVPLCWWHTGLGVLPDPGHGYRELMGTG